MAFQIPFTTVPPPQIMIILPQQKLDILCEDMLFFIFEFCTFNDLRIFSITSKIYYLFYSYHNQKFLPIIFNSRNGSQSLLPIFNDYFIFDANVEIFENPNEQYLYNKLNDRNSTSRQKIINNNIQQEITLIKSNNVDNNPFDFFQSDLMRREQLKLKLSNILKIQNDNRNRIFLFRSNIDFKYYFQHLEQIDLSLGFQYITDISLKYLYNQISDDDPENLENNIVMESNEELKSNREDHEIMLSYSNSNSNNIQTQSTRIKIKYLNLSNLNKITSLSFQVILNIINANDQSLESISLSNISLFNSEYYHPQAWDHFHYNYNDLDREHNLKCKFWENINVNTNVRFLDLSNNDNINWTNEIELILHSFPNLEELNLSNCPKIENVQLFNHKCRLSLKRVNLSNCTKISYLDVSNIIFNCLNIQYINIEKCNNNNMNRNDINNFCQSALIFPMIKF